MLTLVFSLVGGLVAILLLLVIGLPLALLLGFAPWLLTLIAVGLLIKALIARPMTLESLRPALIAFLAALLLRWLF